MSQSTDSDFLGTGWNFPLALTGDRIAVAVGETSIEQSILLILGTTPGERVMKPTFGSRLNALVFAAINTSTLKLAKLYTEEALQRWEPRIQVNSVDAVPDALEPNRIDITVNYTVRSLNSATNVVYPFYLETSP